MLSGPPGYNSAHTTPLWGVNSVISAVSDKKTESGRSGYQNYPSHYTTPLPKI